MNPVPQLQSGTGFSAPIPGVRDGRNAVDFWTRHIGWTERMIRRFENFLLYRYEEHRETEWERAFDAGLLSPNGGVVRKFSRREKLFIRFLDAVQKFSEWYTELMWSWHQRKMEKYCPVACDDELLGIGTAFAIVVPSVILGMCIVVEFFAL